MDCKYEEHEETSVPTDREGKVTYQDEKGTVGATAKDPRYYIMLEKMRKILTVDLVLELLEVETARVNDEATENKCLENNEVSKKVVKIKIKEREREEICDCNSANRAEKGTRPTSEEEKVSDDLDETSHRKKIESIELTREVEEIQRKTIQEKECEDSVVPTKELCEGSETEMNLETKRKKSMS